MRDRTTIERQRDAEALSDQAVGSRLHRALASAESVFLRCRLNASGAGSGIKSRVCSSVVVQEARLPIVNVGANDLRAMLIISARTI